MAGQQPSADTALRSSLVVLGAIAYSVAALAYRFRRHRDVYSGFTHAKVCLLLLLTYSMIASASSYNNVDSTVDDTNHCEDIWYWAIMCVVFNNVFILLMITLFSTLASKGNVRLYNSSGQGVHVVGTCMGVDEENQNQGSTLSASSVSAVYHTPAHQTATSLVGSTPQATSVSNSGLSLSLPLSFFLSFFS